jgi:phage shock protein E
VRARHLLVTLALSVTVAACGAADAAPNATTTPAPPAASDAPDDTGLTGVAAEAAERVVIDVRTPAEVAEGHVTGALLLDVQDPSFREAVADLPRDEAYVVYCRSGNRSGQAIELMRELGFTDLVNGGAYDDLARAGLETTIP